jgi:threonine dehydratase
LSLPAPTIADIRAAAARIAGEAVRTPLLPAETPAGERFFVKAECLQRVGAFKFRGAFNRLSMIPEEARPRGVVACSSGNHAQGVALAARLLGMPATIVMPANAPAVKLDNTRGYGATVVTYDRETQDRDAIAAEIAAQSGAVVVHPFDDPGVIAGQGTVGLEIVEDLALLGLVPDLVVTGASGGGLASGIALALEALAPGARLVTAEPEGFDDYARSLSAGTRLSNERATGSISDALLSRSPGTISFPVLSRLGARGVSVDDAAALRAVAFAARKLKIVAEPGGAVALASVLDGKVEIAGRVVVVVVSGGNIDDETLVRALS